MRLWLFLAGLLASLSAYADDTLLATMARSPVGEVLITPVTAPAGWRTYAISVERAPGYKVWAARGRVVELRREKESWRALFIEVKGSDLVLWSPQALTGKGWRVGIGLEPAGSTELNGSTPGALPTPLPAQDKIAEPGAQPTVSVPRSPTEPKPADNAWLYSPAEISRLPLHARIADVPAGLDQAHPPMGWTSLRLSGLPLAALDRVSVGQINELIDPTGQATPVRGVIVALDRVAKEVRFWAVTRPDVQVKWELRLP